MLETITCVVALCDECGRQFGEDGEGVLYLPSPRELRQLITNTELPDEYRWSIGDDGRITCHLCRLTWSCALSGHDWGAWRLCLCSGDRHPATPGYWCGHQHRMCLRCDQHEFQQIARIARTAGGEAA
ncbi:hypothetical protein SAMN04487905_111153 [Actinopolyspora xinjiangensis]|uniref:Uncharacterized protein n=1 Tax=Actinopolyspora xinjiangensis TaxID=405564 RepID=A0A1H0WB07_9ACTN|nr:hypothetical protein [Actinopolyspora xinjiangensis]SDP87959.1 hypothetical protein SAMN04487905_111153 [Actinopolyspora xinjiangensis]